MNGERLRRYRSRLNLQFRVAFVLNLSDSAGRQEQDNDGPYHATGTPKSLDHKFDHGRRSDRPDADERTGCSGKGGVRREGLGSREHREEPSRS